MRPEDALRGVRALALDLDGTLVDSAPDIAVAANATLAELGMATLEEQRVRGMIGDGIDTLIDRCLAASLGADPDAQLVARARPLVRRFYGQAVCVHSRLYDGVREALDAWRERGLVLACVTNKASQLAAPLIERAGIAPYFAHLYCADQRDERKPSPALLRRFVADAGIPVAECLMIGDSVHDMAAAHAAGMRAIAVDYGYGNPFAEPEAAPALTVSRLDQLTT
jgi:phosphoglycolate phosphatase